MGCVGFDRFTRGRIPRKSAYGVEYGSLYGNSNFGNMVTIAVASTSDPVGVYIHASR